MEDFSFRLIIFGVLLMSLSIHEAAHAWAANRLGDPTARLLGRLTVNPIPHIDPIGTLLLPLVGMLTSLPMLGWAKPVPVNLHQLRHPRRDFMLIAAAGPASNVLQAVVLTIVWHAIPAGIVSSGTPAGAAATAVAYAILLNLVLALFNLIPIPPLDGGNVIGGLLPEQMAAAYDRVVRPFGFLIVYGLLIAGVLDLLTFRPARALWEMLLWR